MSQRRPALIAAALAAALGLGLVVYLALGGDEDEASGAAAALEATSPHDSTPSEDPREPPTLPFGYQWPVGMVLDYQLTLDSESGLDSAKVQAVHVSGSMHLRGLLRLRVLASGGQGLHLGVTLPRLDTLDWTLLGQKMPKERAWTEYFEGRQAVILCQADGQVTGLRFPPDTPRPFANTVEILARQLQAPLEPAQSRWTRRLDAGFGRADSNFTVSTCEAERCNVEMTRGAEDYRGFMRLPAAVPWERAEAKGSQRVVLSRRGHIEEEESGEQIDLFHTDEAGHEAKAVEIRWSTKIILTRRDWEKPQRSFVLDPSWVATQGLPDRARESALKKRAAGMTFAKLREDILTFGNGGKMPRHKAWLWRVTGLLRLHPELARKIAELFHDPSLNGTAKALLLDLLANVGHAEAQQALRDLLGDPEVRARDDYSELVQRFLLVRDPDERSLDFLETRYKEEPTPNARFASVVALGSALGHAADRDPEGVARRLDALTSDLRQSKDPTAQRALVTALGNAGQLESERVLLDFSQSTDSQVRSAAASALRKIHTPEATDRIISLLGQDPDPFVQASAERALAQHQPSAEQLDTLAASFATAPLASENMRALTQTLARLADTLPEPSLPHLRAVAEALLARGVASRSVNHKLAELIARLR